MCMSVRTNLLLPEKLVREVDEIAGPRGRSRYIAEAVEARLKRDRIKRAWEAARGMWRDRPEWKTSDDVVEWVRALRAEETDPGPEARTG
jgi:hypothetical protein